ncbi:Myozenin-1 [Myotis brandtii]|uniref:Myozenin-1 n=1 Tax=Myotis brandtii TaxID=109478 RepID=S7MTU0_MYOBR|nr:Myozenin-1 [Myotis brandtii]
MPLSGTPAPNKKRKSSKLIMELTGGGQESSGLNLGKKISVPRDVMLEELSLLTNRGSKMFKLRQMRVEKFIYENHPDVFSDSSMKFKSPLKPPDTVSPQQLQAELQPTSGNSVSILELVKVGGEYHTHREKIPFQYGITSRSSFLQWGDSWAQLVKDSPMARAAVEARQWEVALLDSMALTNSTIRALDLDLGVQVLQGPRLAEEELLEQQGLAIQEQARDQAGGEGKHITVFKTYISPWERAMGVDPQQKVELGIDLLAYGAKAELPQYKSFNRTAMPYGGYEKASKRMTFQMPKFDLGPLLSEPLVLYNQSLSNRPSFNRTPIPWLSSGEPVDYNVDIGIPLDGETEEL